MEPVRILSALTPAIAAAVAVDALGVGAPGLVLVAVPFLVAMLLLRRSPRTGAAVAAAGCLLVVVTAGLYLSSGELQSGFDALYVFVAAPLALAGIVVAVGVLRKGHALQG